MTAMTDRPRTPIAAMTAARATASARARRRPDTPAELARRLIPGYVVTPAIKLLSDELVRAVETPDARLIVTMPPRTGKSVQTSQVFPVWLLSRDPDAEVIVKSYGDALAEEHSAAARLIAENPPSSASGWRRTSRPWAAGGLPVTGEACWRAASCPAQPGSAHRCCWSMTP